MSGPQLVLEEARLATNALRDAAREGRGIGFRERDKLVIRIHRAFDAFEAMLRNT